MVSPGVFYIVTIGKPLFSVTDLTVIFKYSQTNTSSHSAQSLSRWMLVFNGSKQKMQTSKLKCINKQQKKKLIIGQYFFMAKYLIMV